MLLVLLLLCARWCNDCLQVTWRTKWIIFWLICSHIERVKLVKFKSNPNPIDSIWLGSQINATIGTKTQACADKFGHHKCKNQWIFTNFYERLLRNLQVCRCQSRRNGSLMRNVFWKAMLADDVDWCWDDENWIAMQTHAPINSDRRIGS